MSEENKSRNGEQPEGAPVEHKNSQAEDSPGKGEKALPRDMGAEQPEAPVPENPAEKTQEKESASSSQRSVGKKAKEQWEKGRAKLAPALGKFREAFTGAAQSAKEKAGPTLSKWGRSLKKAAAKVGLENPKNRAIVLGTVLFVLVVAVAISSAPGTVEEEVVAVSAMAPGGDFMRNPTFLLKGAGNLPIEEVEEAITIEPPTAFRVERDGQDLEVILEEPRNIVYEVLFEMEGEGEEEGISEEITLNEKASMTVKIGNSKTSLNQRDPLVLEFSQQVDIRSLEENLVIEPRTAVSYSYDLNKVIITPDSEWIVTNNYRIRIGAGYTSKVGYQFVDNQVLSFKVNAPKTTTYTPPKPYVNFYGDDNFVLNPDEDMTLVFKAEHLRDKKVPVLVETYRMESLEKYREQGHIFLDYDVSLDSMELLDTNAFLIKDGENYFKVPNFGEGTYFLSAVYTDPETKQEKEVRASYLITPLSVYMQSSVRETMVWLNSAGQESPLSGYQVVFENHSDKDASYSGVTDENGLLILPHEKKSNGSPSFRILDEEGRLVYYDNNELSMSKYSQDRYYSYLFLDRTLYKPEDTICFWGFVRSFRYNERELPETVTLRFDEGGLDIVVEARLDSSGVFYGEIELEQIKSSQYYVSAELNFPAQKEGEVGTRYTLDGEYVSVKEYQKPTYVLSSTVHDDFYGPNDQVRVTATAAFYDGTPLPYYPLEVTYYNPKTHNWVSVKDVVTDSTGSATFTFPAAVKGRDLEYGQFLQTNQYKVRIASDGEDITHMNSYRYFPSDMLVDYEITRPEGAENLQLTVRTYALDLTSAMLRAYFDQTSSYSYYSLDNKRLLDIARGEPVDATLDIILRWSYYDQRNIQHRNRQSSSSGSYVKFANAYSLDFTRESWDVEVIEDWETEAKMISVDTSGGVAVVESLIYLPEESVINFDRAVTCSASIKFEDGLENNRTARAYYPDAASYEREWDDYDYSREEYVVPGYSFAITNLSDGTDLTPSASYYRQVYMDAGSTANFQLLLDGVPLGYAPSENPEGEAASTQAEQMDESEEDGEGEEGDDVGQAEESSSAARWTQAVPSAAESGGRLLYTIIQDGLYEHQVIDADSFDLSYPLEYGVSVKLVAAYFDGKETRYVRQLDLYVNDKSMTIDVEVTPDRTSYMPGDQASLQIRATDYQGRGVAGNLVVSVVDEALFALSDQYVNAYYSLYSDLRSMNNWVQQYCSTYRREPEISEIYDGGKGEGGGAEFYDTYRSNFKDTALFLPVTTDASGYASATFTLPDNTTSWRITTVAIGDNLMAGQSRTNIISTLPFFVSPVITTKYIDGDDLALLVQAHGTLLDTDSEINYTVTLAGDGVNTVLTATGSAYQALEFNFGKLPIGSYTVVSRAQFGGYADTVELPVSIIKSNLELVVHKSVDIRQPLDITAMRYPVTITMYDHSNEAFMTSINSLFGHYCMQASQRMSRFVAKRVIRQTIEDGSVPYYIAEGNDSVADMQNGDGGIAAYPGEDSEILVSTYVLLVAKDQFNLNSLARYYRNQLQSEKNEKLRAACYLGLAAINEIEEAELLELLEEENIPKDVEAYLIAALAYLGDQRMDEAITGRAAELYEKNLAPRIANVNDSTKKTLEWERDAAAIWIAASKLGHDDADTLSLHFGKAGWRYRTLFEAMIYTTNYNRRVTPTTFSYTVKGQTTQANLGLTGSHTVVLSRSDLESINFYGVPETVNAVAYYVGEPSEFGLETSENMSIQKNVRRAGDNTYEVSLVISLTKDAPMGQYDISDWVPSNSRLYSHDKSYKPGENKTISFRTTQENQNLYVSFRNPSEQAKTIIYTYRIRQTFQSEAMLDTAYMIHGDTGDNAHTEKRAFEPAPNKGAAAVISEGMEQQATEQSESVADTAEEETAAETAAEEATEAT